AVAVLRFFQGSAEPGRLLGDLAIGGGAGRGEAGTNLGIGEAVDQPRLAYHPLATALDDLTPQPATVLLRLPGGRQGGDAVLYAQGADALQPSPDLDAQIGRLGRQLVDQQQPTVRRADTAFAHVCTISDHRSKSNTCILNDISVSSAEIETGGSPMAY